MLALADVLIVWFDILWGNLVADWLVQDGARSIFLTKKPSRQARSILSGLT